MNLEAEVKAAAKESGITGVMEMGVKCGLSPPRTRRVWTGNEDAKIRDVRQLLQSVGYDLAIVERVK